MQRARSCVALELPPRPKSELAGKIIAALVIAAVIALTEWLLVWLPRHVLRARRGGGGRSTSTQPVTDQQLLPMQRKLLPDFAAPMSAKASASVLGEMPPIVPCGGGVPTGAIEVVVLGEAVALEVVVERLVRDRADPYPGSVRTERGVAAAGQIEVLVEGAQGCRDPVGGHLSALQPRRQARTLNPLVTSAKVSVAPVKLP